MNLRQGCSSPKVIHRNVIRDRIPGVVNAYEQQQKRRPRHCKQRLTEIIQNQVPDAEGNLIPASVRQGSARLAGSRAENEHILIAADSGIYNVPRRHAITTAKYATAM